MESSRRQRAFHDLHADGKTLITGGHDQLVKLWDLETRELKQSLAGHKGGVTCGALDRSGQVLVTGSWDKSLCVWDLAKGELTKRLAGLAGEVRSVAFTPDGKRLICGDWSGGLKVLDTQSWETVADLPQQSRPVLRIAVSPDGKFWATATGNWKERNVPGEVVLWDSTTLEPVRKLPTTNVYFESVGFSPDGKLLAYGDSSAGLHVWNVEANRMEREMKDKFGIYGIVFTSDSRRIATAQWSGPMSLWDISTGRKLAAYAGHAKSVYGISVSPSGTQTASACDDGTVRLWSLTVVE
ncbi:MAG: WD40 repeat domain-containing protein [Pirellulaceae bacterium]